MGLGNRGMHFEKLINLANEMYQIGRVALINKRPTPVKVIKSKGSQVINGFYESKSTVDYDCVYKGRAIAFEAKSTENATRFDLKKHCTASIGLPGESREDGSDMFLPY